MVKGSSVLHLVFESLCPLQESIPCLGAEADGVGAIGNRRGLIVVAQIDNVGHRRPLETLLPSVRQDTVIFKDEIVLVWVESPSQTSHSQMGGTAAVFAVV
jgi:hypothetical protein